jgi:hypothetical protein
VYRYFSPQPSVASSWQNLSPRSTKFSGAGEKIRPLMEILLEVNIVVFILKILDAKWEGKKLV